MKMKYLSRLLLSLMFFTFSTIAFQNCAPSLTRDPAGLANTNSSNPQSSNNSGTAPQEMLLPCSLPDGSKLNPGQSVQGYAMNSMLYPLTCGKTVKRTCLSSGQFDGSVPVYNACNQLCVHPDSKQPVGTGTTYIYYTKNTGTTQADCDSARVTSTCQLTTGQFSPSIPAQKFAACLVAGQTCAYNTFTGTAVPSGYSAGATVKGYVAQTATYPTLCGAQKTLTCQTSGSWGGTIPIYSSCAQKCLHPDTNQPVDANFNFIYYTIAEGTATQCSAAKVTSVCQSSTGLFNPVPKASGRFSVCKEYPLPTLSSLSAVSTTIQPTEMATLSWSSLNAVSLTLNPGKMDVTGKTTITLTPTATTTYTLTATNPAGSVTQSISITVTSSMALTGQALYENKCSACHSPFAVSNLKGRTITDSIINSAITSKIAVMKPLMGTMTADQISSLVPLFAGGGSDTGVMTSSFACANTDAEKNSSVNLVRLTGTELKNTYSSLVPAAAWTALNANLYLLPTDNFDGLIGSFVGTYTADYIEQISRFNELLANQIVASSANITSFFGTCATTSTFDKACLDSFLASKGAKIYRAAVATADNSNLWTAASQATSATDKMKIVIQILFNDPRFLFQLELGEGAADVNGLMALTSYEIANRIAYGMTSAPADATLWNDAVQNKLKNLTTIASHVDRIAQTAAFKNKVLAYIKFYIGVNTSGTAPNVTSFLNGISANGLDSAATDEFNEFVNYIVFTKKGNLKDLFNSQAAFPKTTAMATILGTSVWTSGNPVMAPNHYGILTRPYIFMVSTPMLKLVQRGKKIRINMLCTDVPQPSETDLAGRPQMSEDDLINLTRRNFTDKATLSGASCTVCHAKMNELGYATGTYDSIGRFSTVEKIYNSNNTLVAQHTVVTTIKPTIIENDTRTFANIFEFQAELAKSDTLQQCFSRKTFQFFQKKSENISQDSCRLNKIDNLIKKDMPLYDVFLENFKQQSVLYKRSK